MEEVSDQNLDWFFHQWLYQPGFPELVVSWKWKSETHQMIIDVSQNQQIGPIFRILLELGITLSGDSIQIHALTIDKQKNRFTISLAKKPDRVELDPYVWTLLKGQLTEL